MRQLLDFLPVLIFFICFKTFDIFIATKALLIATSVVLLILWLSYRHKEVTPSLRQFILHEKVTIVTSLLVVLFSSLTLYFKNADFLIWKVSVIYGLFALILFISQFFFQKPLLRLLLGKEVHLPARIWAQLNLAWTLLFVIFAVINLYIGFYYSQATWINFKTFVFPIALALFSIITAIYIYQFLPKDGDDNTSPPAKKQ